MPIRHEYTHICDYAARGYDGKEVIAGSFINVQLKSLPDTLGQMYIAVGLTGEPGEAFRISLVDPSGAELIDFGSEVIPEEDSERSSPVQVFMMSMVAALKRIRFESEGRYAVVILDGDGNELHRREFGVFVGPELLANEQLDTP
jgi:hypothetical protein